MIPLCGTFGIFDSDLVAVYLHCVSKAVGPAFAALARGGAHALEAPQFASVLEPVVV